jgi:subtilase family serine protease
MSLLRAVIAVAGSAAVISAAAVGMSTAAGAAARSAQVPLAGSAAPFTAHTRAMGAVAGSQTLTIQLWLKPDLAAAEQFDNAVSTPGSASFRHFLSPAAYTARFGPTVAQAEAVTAWLRSQGFTDVSAGAQRDYVRATATARTIDTAFHVTMTRYKASKQVNAGRFALRANDRPVTLPASLAGSVLGVTGLDNAAPVLPLERLGQVPATGIHASAAQPACSSYYGQHTVSGLPSRFGVTSFPTEGCGYSATQLRGAYGANTVNTGKGETVALIELGLAPKMFPLLQDYAKAIALPAPSAARYKELDLQPSSCPGDAFYDEEQLDVEASYDVAPGASTLVVGGDGCDNGDYGLQGLADAEAAVIDGNGSHPLATIASNSWGNVDEETGTVATNVAHAFLVKAAAVGVGMYFASGDSSGVAAPANDPYAIAVGGTTVGVGKKANRVFETGWSTGSLVSGNNKWYEVEEVGAAGGGPSLMWREPAYQKGVVPAAMTQDPGDRSGAARSVPDLSADADPYTGMSVGLLDSSGKFVVSTFGGTSLATPLVAGLVADAQQGQAKPFGFLNPTLYKLAGSSAFHDALPLTSANPALWRAEECATQQLCGFPYMAQFDDEDSTLPGYIGQVTAKGYDNMTGVGSPNGQAFIAAIRAMG